MRIIKKARRMICVYWEPPVNTGEEEKFPQPTEHKCSWEDVEKIRDLKAEGKQFLSESSVLMDVITEKGGFLWLGTLDELKEANNGIIDSPLDIPGARKIEEIETIGTLKSKDIRKGKANMDETAHWAFV